VLDPHFSEIVAFGLRGTTAAESSIAINDCSMSGVAGMLRGIVMFEGPGKIR
jgi:hypothetical protein